MNTSNCLMFGGDFSGSETIRTTPDKKFVSVYDVIESTGGQKNPHSVWERLKSNNPEVLCYQTFKFPGRGQQNTPIIHFSNVKDLIKLFLPGSRISKTKKQKVMQEFEMNESENIRVYIEEEVNEKILKALKMFNGIQQFSVLGYRIDLYFPEQKVAVECDENGHRYYLNDEIRMKKITGVLGNEWIRYNPYDRDFDIYNLINQILLKLLK